VWYVQVVEVGAVGGKQRMVVRNKKEACKVTGRNVYKLYSKYNEHTL